MRKHAKTQQYVKLKRSSMAVLLCLSMLFITACGGNGGEPDRAMGRYVETQLEFPEEGNGPSFMQQRPDDGTIDVYFAQDETGREYLRYNSKNGENWEKHQVPWKIPDHQFINGLICDKEGVTWISTVTYSDDGTVLSYVYRTGDDGILTPIDIEWKDESGVPIKQRLEGLKIAENGSLLIEIWNLGVGQYTPQGKLIRFLGADVASNSYESGFAVSGNKVYMIDGGSSSVVCYSAEDGNLIQTTPFDSFTDSTSIACGSDGSVLLSNRNGVFRLTEGGSMWEKLVDGTLTSMFIPTLYFFSLIEGTDGAYYMAGGDSNSTQLYRYAYDPNIATLPEKELVVYSMYENGSLQQAAGEFQRNHPDTRVNIQVAVGDENGATESDLIRALNTELLNGKGPDVLMLDGMPVDSYIEKGVLQDLSDLLKEIKADKTLNSTVAYTYKNRDGIFAVPSKFNMPALYTDKEYAGELTGLESMVKLAQTHGDKPLMGDKSPRRLMEVLFSSCAPAWIEDGEIDEAGLKTFLESIRLISETPAKSYTMEEEAEGGEKINSVEDLYHWAFGRALTLPCELQGGISLSSPTLAMRQEGNGTIMHMPGQAEAVYIPVGILGINAKSKMADSAEDFVKMMLSDQSQQATSGRKEGLPVSLAALDALVNEVEDDVYLGITGGEENNEELSGLLPTPEEKRPIQELCNSVKTPFKADSVLAEMIINEAQDYFTGEKDIDQTISDIGEATKLYLSE